MKKSGLMMMVLLTASLASAQTAPQSGAPAPAEKKDAPQVERTNKVEAKNAPTESDMYCSGYITRQPVSHATFIVGGWNTPEQERFAERSYIYLNGPGLQEGQKLQIVRPTRDLNEYKPYRGQEKDIAAHGQTYEETGRVRVVMVKDQIAVAFVELSCSDLTPGDLAVPWPEREKPAFHRPVPFDRWAQPNGKLTARIIAAKESQLVASSRDKIYIAAGADQGIKPGDYFRLTHTYQATMDDEVEGLAFNTTQDPSQKGTPKLPKVAEGRIGFGSNKPKNETGTVDKFPRQSMGEAMVLYTTPTTSTAIVTTSIDQIRVGDMAELMDPLPPAPPEPEPVMNPPTISCSASPASVRAGESATIRCEGASADDRPITYSFATDAGTVTPRGDSLAILDTPKNASGAIHVIATAMDDRNMSTSATTAVGIEAPPPPEQPSMMNELVFKPNSAYVDNTAKAVLDGVALRLGKEANSSAMIAGSTAAGEAPRLSMLRANNARTYLTREKGIDAARIQVGDRGRAGRSGQVWFVPAGAAMPQITPAAGPAAAPATAPASQTPKPKPVTKKPATSTPKPK